MNYFKNEDGAVFAYDDEQIALGLADDKTAMTAEEVEAHLNPPKTIEQVVAGYVVALERHYDAVAQSWGYDNRLTCALRAGYAGPYQAEGVAFAVWMDNCNFYAYEQLDLVQSGDRETPTTEELVSELPEIVRPV